MAGQEMPDSALRMTLEYRDGKLVPTGRVITAADLQPLVDLHNSADGDHFCDACGLIWPCESARLLTALLDGAK